MGVRAGLYMYDVAVKRFTFTVSSPDEFLSLFVNQISRERLNGYVPNSQGRHVWSLTQTSLNVKVKGQGDKKYGVTPITPWQRTDGMQSLQMTSYIGRWDHSIAAWW